MSVSILPEVQRAPDTDDGSLRGTLVLSANTLRTVVRGVVLGLPNTVGEPTVTVQTVNGSLVISVSLAMVYPDGALGVVLDEMRGEIVTTIERQLGRNVHRLDLAITELVDPPTLSQPRVV
jgi:hypothetical protein